MAKGLGSEYPAWLKAWAKKGSPKWPEHISAVAVHWIDAAFYEDNDDDDHAPLDSLTIGFVIEATPKHLALTTEVFQDQSSRRHLTVPAGMVKRVFNLATIRAFHEE